MAERREECFLEYEQCESGSFSKSGGTVISKGGKEEVKVVKCRQDIVLLETFDDSGEMWIGQ
ncbi:hypothetical protein N7508_007130 [Penicillium antarcticum]|uniref:uncharacterized protein n=1 Tax=Penicillium antarcticum TaxID=416450 RepID=UPI0023A0739E|nr:uncharacterized protein N7508_007130 [Penicillium antarcticum]KAJ5302267.1 hypothetical protein N7508_007130 [Penicillium antarcticum]